MFQMYVPTLQHLNIKHFKLCSVIKYLTLKFIIYSNKTGLQTLKAKPIGWDGLVCMYKYNFNVQRILSNIPCIKSINFLRPHSQYDVIFLIFNSTKIRKVWLRVNCYKCTFYSRKLPILLSAFTTFTIRDTLKQNLRAVK